MKIGGISFENNIALAPMAGITDMPFRLLCKEQGCGLVYTEMVSAKGMHFNSARSGRLTEINELERPASVQLFGSDPEIMAGIASRLNDSNADIVDINMGCPTPKITRNGEGCALMLRPSLAYEIIRSVVSVSKKPVTVKIRKGWNDSMVNAVEMARLAEDAGAAAIAIHGRTREQFYGGIADWNIIRMVKEAVTIPVIGNGDVKTPGDAQKMFLETGCDAVMIGREARGNPWIFRRIIDYLKRGIITPEPSVDERIDTALRHMGMLIEIKGEKKAICEMRKHIAWYIRGLHNSAHIRQMVFKTLSADEIITLLNTIKTY